MSTALKTALAIALEESSVGAHPIPPITDPMGKHWDQPCRFSIEVDSTHALMSKRDFEALAEYSCSQPTGVYPGKMWKRLDKNGWWLCWFGIHPDPKYCSNHYRKILIA